MIRTAIMPALLLMCIGFSCRDPYNPGLDSSSESYLVIEGVLNAGNGSTSLFLSRTFKLDDTAVLRTERNAMVTVEGKDNTTRQLAMTGDGIYTAPNLNLVLNQEYRLRIVTTAGKEYLSDYVVARQTPPIDDITFHQNDKGVQIHVTTHDNANSTRYYLWSYDETWEIRTYYYSKYRYINDTVLPRTQAEDVYTCWKYGSSNEILIGSSAAYETDTIPEAPVRFIGNGDERLAVRYSILVKQTGLDKKGYEFYELMKKNTESIGTIFDPQPSQVKGNIHSVSDPNEQVIGNIAATTVEEKRIFIEATDLDRWKFNQYCSSYDIVNNLDSIKFAYATGLSIYDAIFSRTQPNVIDKYQFSFAPCVDCTKRGGDLSRPPYW